jgi:transposase
VDANGMPVRAIVTAGTTADCKQAIPLISGIAAEYLFADRAYDTNGIIEYATKAGMQVVIPPKKNRKEQREYDEHLYKLRHLVENAFMHLKRWRGIATRYAKNSSSFVAAVQIRCIAIWSKILVD